MEGKESVKRKQKTRLYHLTPETKILFLLRYFTYYLLITETELSRISFFTGMDALYFHRPYTVTEVWTESNSI